MANINIDQLSMEIMRNLEIYQANTLGDVEYAVKKVAKDTASELQETSPVGYTGDYADSWSYRRNPNSGKDHMSMVVYAQKPGYRLSHLLEHGHDAVDGGFVSARPHIRQAEGKASLWLEDLLSRKLRG